VRKTTDRSRKRYRKYPKEMRAMAMERLKNCANVTALSKELGINREVLYKWRARMEAGAGVARPESRERRQRGEVDELKRLLAERTLEVDFFKGALQKVAARRQNNTGSGEKASTTKSGS
jgi:transposase-like protein